MAGMHPDPIDGYLGALDMSGWIADAPTGQEEAYILLTTPVPEARERMPLLAVVLGLTPTPGVTMHPCAGARIELRPGTWTAIMADTTLLGERPMSDEWVELARTRGRVVVAVGYAPLGVGDDIDEYTERHGAEISLGLIPAVDA